MGQTDLKDIISNDQIDRNFIETLKRPKAIPEVSSKEQSKESHIEQFYLPNPSKLLSLELDQEIKNITKNKQGLPFTVN